jgi:hypothetical protein
MRLRRDQRMQYLWPCLIHTDRHELPILLSLLLVAGAIWTFAVLADEGSEGETHAFDRAILLAMRAPDDPSRPWGPPWLAALARDYTALGSMGILTLNWLRVFHSAGASGIGQRRRQQRQTSVVW